MKTLLYTFAWVATFAVTIPQVALAQANPKTQTGMNSPSPKQSNQPPSDPQAELPRFNITEPLEADSTLFAKQLGAKIGVEIRFPKQLRQTLGLPARTWTAPEALKAVAKQIEGYWKPVLVFQAKTTKEPNASKATPSKLHSLGKITLQREPMSFDRLAKLVATRTGSELEKPKAVEGRFAADWREIPVEQVIQELAEKAGLAVSIAIRFEQNETDTQRQLDENERSLRAEQERRQEIASQLEATFGLDPHGADFPWELVPAAFWQEQGIDLEDVEGLCNAIATDGERGRVTPAEQPDPQEAGEPLP